MIGNINVKRLLFLVIVLQSTKPYAQSNSVREQLVFDSASARFQRNTHPVVLDSASKIIPWTKPQSMAYDVFLRNRWSFIKTMVPNSPGPAPRSNYPQYYFYCAFKAEDGQLKPDTWMNDVGEKMPNWFESARLYYAYTGDSSVMKIISDFPGLYACAWHKPCRFFLAKFPLHYYKCRRYNFQRVYQQVQRTRDTSRSCW